jgi:hypothetical protein
VSAVFRADIGTQVPGASPAIGGANWRVRWAAGMMVTRGLLQQILDAIVALRLFPPVRC